MEDTMFTVGLDAARGACFSWRTHEILAKLEWEKMTESVDRASEFLAQKELDEHKDYMFPFIVLVQRTIYPHDAYFFAEETSQWRFFVMEILFPVAKWIDMWRILTPLLYPDSYKSPKEAAEELITVTAATAAGYLGGYVGYFVGALTYESFRTPFKNPDKPMTGAIFGGFAFSVILSHLTKEHLKKFFAGYHIIRSGGDFQTDLKITPYVRLRDVFNSLDFVHQYLKFTTLPWCLGFFFNMERQYPFGIWKLCVEPHRRTMAFWIIGFEVHHFYWSAKKDLERLETRKQNGHYFTLPLHRGRCIMSFAGSFFGSYCGGVFALSMDNSYTPAARLAFIMCGSLVGSVGLEILMKAVIVNNSTFEPLWK